MHVEAEILRRRLVDEWSIGASATQLSIHHGAAGALPEWPAGTGGDRVSTIGESIPGVYSRLSLKISPNGCVDIAPNGTRPRLPRRHFSLSSAAHGRRSADAARERKLRRQGYRVLRLQVSLVQNRLEEAVLLVQGALSER